MGEREQYPETFVDVRVPTPYQNGFGDGYDGYGPVRPGPAYIQGWNDGRDAWEQESERAKKTRQ